MTEKEFPGGGRQYSPLDQLFISAQTALTTVFGSPRGTGRPDPAESVDCPELDPEQMRESARLMRVNHVGEVCAQALYEGPALAARSGDVRDAMSRAAAEEQDHLLWCEQRIKELGGRKSLLNPLWYTGALCIGAFAGVAGDKWSLGFLRETEEQVEAHLDSHLDRLPLQDLRSRAVVSQMKSDERAHAQTAQSAGGATLPWPLSRLMRTAARIMTGAARWV